MQTYCERKENHGTVPLMSMELEKIQHFIKNINLSQSLAILLAKLVFPKARLSMKGVSLQGQILQDHVYVDDFSSPFYLKNIYLYIYVFLQPECMTTVAIFKASALWADAFYKSICQSVRVSVCPCVHF